MTITLELTPELKARLERAATEACMTRERYVLRLLDENLPRQIDHRRALEVLESFYQGDEQEQRETLEFLKRALDEDRPGQRKLFP